MAQRKPTNSRPKNNKRSNQQQNKATATGRWVTRNGQHLFIQDKGIQQKSNQLKRRKGDTGKLAESQNTNKLKNGATGKGRKGAGKFKK